MIEELNINESSKGDYHLKKVVKVLQAKINFEPLNLIGFEIDYFNYNFKNKEADINVFFKSVNNLRKYFLNRLYPWLHKKKVHTNSLIQIDNFIYTNLSLNYV